MLLDSLALLYFSPTGTTKRVLEGIAGGLGARHVTRIDLASRTATADIRKTQGSLTLIGAPVYTGRVALPAAAAMERIRVKETPAVLVVVYGHREYEDALLELRNISTDAGFAPVAGAIFIGEHSFSTRERPIAEGRPDEDDIAKAEAFGLKVKAKMGDLSGLGNLPLLHVPGNFPYRERGPSLNTSPEIDMEACAQCGACVEACPMGAIRSEGAAIVTDKGKCIVCCACVKNCPSEARALKDPRLTQFAAKLAEMCSVRKEPEFYF